MSKPLMNVHNDSQGFGATSNESKLWIATYICMMNHDVKESEGGEGRGGMGQHNDTATVWMSSLYNQ